MAARAEVVEELDVRALVDGEAVVLVVAERVLDRRVGGRDLQARKKVWRSARAASHKEKEQRRTSKQSLEMSFEAVIS